jgi:DNA repair exonuclease SbcCD ATPase subunit
VKREEEFKAKWEEVNQEFQRYKSGQEFKEIQWRNELSQLKEANQDLEEHIRSGNQGQRLELDQAKAKIVRLQSEIEQLRSNPSPKRVRVEVAATQRTERSAGIDKEERQMLKSLLETTQTRLKQMEKENMDSIKKMEFYKNMYENSEKLRERIRGMEHQLGLFDKLRNEHAELVLQLEELEREKQNWLQVSGEQGFRTPYEAFQKINELKLIELKQIEKVGDLESQFKAVEAKNNALHAELEKLRQQLVEKTMDLQSCSTTIRRNDARVTLLQTENTRLKEMLVL